jgi:hypothetical protein
VNILWFVLPGLICLSCRCSSIGSPCGVCKGLHWRTRWNGKYEWEWRALYSREESMHWTGIRDRRSDGVSVQVSGTSMIRDGRRQESASTRRSSQTLTKIFTLSKRSFLRNIVQYGPSINLSEIWRRRKV